MLDIKYIREKQEEIKAAAKNKNIIINLAELLRLDDERRNLQTKIDYLREERNNLAKSGKDGKPSKETIEKGKLLKTEISAKENELLAVEDKYFELMALIPTIPAADVPIGKDETQNTEIYRWGKIPEFSFPIKTHIELSEILDIIDFERGVKTGGFRSYYLKNEGSFLQIAIMTWAMHQLYRRGFLSMIPPTLVREFVLFGSGYFKGCKYNPQIDEIYKIENPENIPTENIKKENKFLVGTSEPSLLAYYSNEIIDEKDLPMKLSGLSQCYRSEIGSYGKDTKGLYRVHEFMKVEQVVLCQADISVSEKLHQEIITISKELHEALGLPYRQLQICTGDMSAGKYKMFDLEAWMPGLNRWGETGSASNFLDWQARRLNVRYRDKNGDIKFVYMLNNTALATPRTIIAILENYQQADGSVIIPEVLRKYMPEGMDIIKPKNKI
jgi:seryl-tRNA synthetase